MFLKAIKSPDLTFQHLTLQVPPFWHCPWQLFTSEEKSITEEMSGFSCGLTNGERIMHWCCNMQLLLERGGCNQSKVMHAHKKCQMQVAYETNEVKADNSPLRFYCRRCRTLVRKNQEWSQDVADINSHRRGKRKGNKSGLTLSLFS